MAVKPKRTKRRAARSKTRKRRRWLRALKVSLAVLVVGVLVGLLGSYVRDARFLRVKTIGIVGAEVLEEDHIAEASGVTNIDNTLLLNTLTVRSRVEALPYVEYCRVERVFPDTVVIRVEERVAVATLMVHNQLFELDAEGVVLRQLEPQARYPGPMITQLPDMGTVEPGQRLSDSALQDALAIWQEFSAIPMAGEVTVSEIAAPNRNNIRMYCDELPFELRWGRRGDPDENRFQLQAQRLQLLWDEKEGQLDCEEYLDLRFDRDLACR